MNLYTIIKTLQETQGSKAKLAFLESHKDNALLKQYLKAVYDPAINYYQKRVAITKENQGHPFCEDIIDTIKHYICDRNITGNAAKQWLEQYMYGYNVETQELIQYMIKRSIEAGVSDSTILKVFPDLYFIPPYQRCSLPDAKIIDKFNKEGEILVQQKLDGMFAYLVNDNGDCSAITRNGSKFTPEFAELLFGEYKEDCKDQVIIGEIIVLKEGNILDRKTGNGILNSILQSGEIPKNYEYQLIAWDHLTVSEFKSGVSEYPYCTRLENLEWVYPHIVEMYYVKTVEQAYGVYRKFLEQGHEGAVMKTKHFKWKNGTSKDQVKLKLKFQVDLKVVGIIEGTGKYEGMMGSVSVESSDGKLKVDVGSGWNDEQRKNGIEVGSIITVEANDIITNRSNDTYSLFLPIFIEERFDKTESDSYDDCVAQLEAAKQGE